MSDAETSAGTQSGGSQTDGPAPAEPSGPVRSSVPVGVAGSRWSLTFILLGLLSAALLYDRLVPPEPVDTVVAESEQVVISPSLSDPARLDGAWYCPVGSSAPDGYADHVVNITNFAETDAVATVSILTDVGPGPRQRLALGPLSTERVSLSDLGEFQVAGAVVVITGGSGAVSHSVMTAQGSAEGPCATESSDTWYFAGGRTTVDADYHLVLMNPFPEAARYDVSFRTGARSVAPGSLRGAVLPPRSVAVIEVDAAVAREPLVSTVITTERGRLVVERLQVLDGQLGPAGAALQLGVANPARSWMFTGGRVQGDGADELYLYNPNEVGLVVDPGGAESPGASTQPTEAAGQADLGAGLVDDGSGLEGFDIEGTAAVSVQLWPLDPADLDTFGVVTIRRTVGPDSVISIDLQAQAERFELPLPYELGVSVFSDDGLAIVAERWHQAQPSTDDPLGTVVGTSGDADADADAGAGEGEASGDGAENDNADENGGEDPGLVAPEVVTDLPQPIADAGIGTSRGSDLFSSRWVIPWVFADEESTLIAVASSTDTAIEVRVLRNGSWDGPFRTSVAAGGRAVVPIVGLGGGAAVEVSADAPVSVEATVVRPGQSLDVVAAVPVVG